MSWTQDDIDTLKRLVAQGLSSGQIVKHLSGTYTRNAVIGKAYRLGLPRSPEAARHLKTAGARKAVALQRAIAGIKSTRGKSVPRKTAPIPNSEPLPPPAETDVARITSVLDLQSHHCRWISGDPKQPGWGYCGARKVDGLPYCEHHARRAYRQPQEVERVPYHQTAAAKVWRVA